MFVDVIKQLGYFLFVKGVISNDVESCSWLVKYWYVGPATPA